MNRLLLILVFVIHIGLPSAAAQDTRHCDPADLQMLTADLLQHFNEIDKIQTELIVTNYRLNLFWEYITFIMGCRQPVACDTLSATYAKAIAEAQTRDELAILSANFTADVIICQPIFPLTGILNDAGFSCDVMYADETFAAMECTGKNDLSVAQGIYQAARAAQPTLEQISVTLTSADSKSRYIYTGQEWLTEIHYSP